MKEYTLRDGSVVRADPSNPEHAAFLQAQGAQPVKSQPLKAVGSGLVEGAARLPFLLSDLANIGLDTVEDKFSPEWMKSEGYQSFRKAHKGSGWLDEALGAVGTGFFKPQTQADRYLNLGAQGVGGGLATVAPRLAAPAARVLPFAKPTLPPELIRSTAARAAVPAAAAGGVGAVSGEAAVQATGEENPLIRLAASLIGGGLAGYGASRMSASNQALAQAGQAHSADDFAEASANLERMRRSGAQTHTLGEAFPGESPFLGITGEATAQGGSNALIARMAGRGEDLQQIAGRALDAVAPAQNTNAVASRAAEAANARLGTFSKYRSSKTRAIMDRAAPLPAGEVKALHDMLMQLAKSDQSGIRKEAFEAVADVLKQPNPIKQTVMERVKVGNTFRLVPREVLVRPPKTDVQAIADDLKQLQKSLTAPATGTGGQRLNAAAVTDAYRLVDDWLQQQSPEYAKAMRRYATISHLLNNPARQSPLAAMAGKDGNLQQPTAVGRLEGLVNKQSPTSIEATLASLEKGAQASGRPGIVPPVVRSILQERVATGRGNLGDRLAGGAAGSEGAQRTQAMLRAVGPNTAAFDDPVETLRLLSRVNSMADVGGRTQRAKEMGTGLGTATVAPLQHLYQKALFSTTKGRYREIAALLANPTQDNLRRLYQLSQNDPALRLHLGLTGGMVGGANALPLEE